MTISIASYSFNKLIAAGKMDVFGYLESCKYRYRLDTADIWNGLMGSTEPDYARKVREAVDHRGMRVVNYHVDGIHLWENDPDKRERNYKQAQAHLRVAEILGAQTVRIDTGGTVVPMTPEQLDMVAGRYRDYARWADGVGARVGPETHWGFSVMIDNMERIARAVDHKAYGVLHHIGRWYVADNQTVKLEEEAALDRRIAPWTCHTHLDSRIASIALRERIAVMRDGGYDGCWGIECPTDGDEYHEVAWLQSELVRALG
jgi:sugar phosphate isomerase/epimerase